MRERTGVDSATVRKDGARLVFDGALDRAACAGLWRQAQPLLGGFDVLDLTAVRVVDSAGLALLAEIAARSPGASVTGAPAGLSELRAAYRLDDTLGFAG
jgi:phospholipid transport system transporter-binding protein